MTELAQVLRESQTTDVTGHAVAEAVGRQIGFSSLCLLRITGAVVSPSDRFALGARESSEKFSSSMGRVFSLIERELLPFAKFFGSKSFDIAERFDPAVVRRSEVFNTFWRPLGVERQLVGPMGPPEAPRGFLCAARTARESPFTAGDLRAFEQIRTEVDGEFLAARHLGSQDLEATLAALAGATPDPWLLFDAKGTLLWLTEEARQRLAADSTRIGASIALRHCDGLAHLQARVRLEARGRSLAPGEVPVWPGKAPGERLVIRRYDQSGRSFFLIGIEGRAFLEGEQATDPRAGARTVGLARIHGLTPRQAEVLTHLATGKTNKAIATILGCAEGTVELHVTALLAKFECSGRTELVARFWMS